jgi:prevent-host-death family protein
MEAVTIREAKARLNALVEAAERGEQVVLMRGSKLVAAIVPISAHDLELASSLTDPQAERLWRQLSDERRDGSSVLLDSPADAVAFLSGRATRRKAGAAPPSSSKKARRR